MKLTIDLSTIDNEIELLKKELDVKIRVRQLLIHYCEDPEIKIPENLGPKNFILLSLQRGSKTLRELTDEFCNHSKKYAGKSKSDFMNARGTIHSTLRSLLSKNLIRMNIETKGVQNKIYSSIEK